MGKTVNIRGKEYRTVAGRIADFRELCPARDGWALLSTVTHRDDEVVVVVASIVDPQGRTVAQGTAEERRKASKINATSALENAETSAWGRALAAFGLGGDEVASADELVNALEAQRDNAARSKEQAEAADLNDWREQVTQTGADFGRWVEWCRLNGRPVVPAAGKRRNALAYIQQNPAVFAGQEA